MGYDDEEMDADEDMDAEAEADVEMDEVAESGIAAHWIYKQGGGGGGGGGKNSMNQFAWLRQLVDDVRRQSDPKEFVKSVKEDLFAKEVFVFSPTGDIYPLAR